MLREGLDSRIGPVVRFGSKIGERGEMSGDLRLQVLLVEIVPTRATARKSRLAERPTSDAALRTRGCRSPLGIRGLAGHSGASPSGKAGDFESSIRWFESSRPSHAFRARMKPREVLERLFEAWRAGDALRSAAHFAPDATYRETRHEPIEGRDAIVAHFTRFFRDGPQWRFEVDEVIVEGERAAVRYRFAVADSEGSWREKPGCAFVAFRDGTVAEWREYQG